MASIKPWKQIPSELNSSNQAVITPSSNVQANQPLINGPGPILKKDSNLGDSSIPRVVPDNIESGNNNNANIMNSNSNFSSGIGGYGGYGGMSGMGGMGGMGGYGGMSGYGGYGGYSSYGGLGGFGGGYGGLGGLGPRGLTNQENPGFLDNCFVTIEKMNFQLFHLCELARMIHQQSAALGFLYEMITKAYATVKAYTVSKSTGLYESISQQALTKVKAIKTFLKEFVSKSSDLDDSKIKQHIKLLDKILLLIIMVSGVSMLAQIVVNKRK